MHRPFRQIPVPGFPSRRPAPATQGFTLVEVMVAMGLILFSLVGIYTMQAQSLRIVQSAHDSSGASQVLQQRLEQLRANPYDTIVTATGLTALMTGSSGGTRAEQVMTAVKNFQESVKVSRYARPGVTPAPAGGSFTVVRTGTSASSTGTLTTLVAESEVKAQLTVQWTDRQGAHRREFSTILSRGGVSAAGISKTPVTASVPLQ